MNRAIDRVPIVTLAQTLEDGEAHAVQRKQGVAEKHLMLDVKSTLKDTEIKVET